VVVEKVCEPAGGPKPKKGKKSKSKSAKKSKKTSTKKAGSSKPKSNTSNSTLKPSTAKAAFAEIESTPWGEVPVYRERMTDRIALDQVLGGIDPNEGEDLISSYIYTGRPAEVNSWMSNNVESYDF